MHFLSVARECILAARDNIVDVNLLIGAGEADFGVIGGKAAIRHAEDFGIHHWLLLELFLALFDGVYAAIAPKTKHLVEVLLVEKTNHGLVDSKLFVMQLPVIHVENRVVPLALLIADFIVTQSKAVILREPLDVIELEQLNDILAILVINAANIFEINFPMFQKPLIYMNSY